MRSLSLPYMFLVKKTNTHQTRTCSELSIETLGKGVKISSAESTIKTRELRHLSSVTFYCCL